MGMIPASDKKMEVTLAIAQNLSYNILKAQCKPTRKSGDIAHEIEECTIQF